MTDNLSKHDIEQFKDTAAKIIFGAVLMACTLSGIFIGWLIWG